MWAKSRCVLSGSFNTLPASLNAILLFIRAFSADLHACQRKEKRCVGLDKAHHLYSGQVRSETPRRMRFNWCHWPARSSSIPSAGAGCALEKPTGLLTTKPFKQVERERERELF